MIVIIILLAPRVQYPVDRDQWISYSLCNNRLWTKRAIHHPADIAPFHGAIVYGLESSHYACQLEGIQFETGLERFIDPTDFLRDPGYFYHLPPAAKYPPAPRAPGAHINTLHLLQTLALNPDGTHMYSYNVTWDEVLEIPQPHGEPLLLNTPFKPSDVIWIISTRDLLPDEELLLDYGDEYVLPLPHNWRDLVTALPQHLPREVEERLMNMLGHDFRSLPPLQTSLQSEVHTGPDSSPQDSHTDLPTPPKRHLGKEFRSDSKNAVREEIDHVICGGDPVGLPPHPSTMDFPSARVLRYTCSCLRLVNALPSHEPGTPADQLLNQRRTGQSPHKAVASAPTGGGARYLGQAFRSALKNAVEPSFRPYPHLSTSSAGEDHALVVILGPTYRMTPDTPLSDVMLGAPSEEEWVSADQSHLLAPSARVLGQEYRSDRKNAVEPTHPDFPMIFLSHATQDGYAHAFTPPQ
jgi:hypothetical protein